jgi:signal transduction histidine kinase/DNA-binding response OmpR family regulator
MTRKDQGRSQSTGEASPVCNILVVDDEPQNLLAIEAILEPLGQHVVRATSGVEALRHALKMEFCVVLLDVQMPEMDGIETAELLRKRPKTRDVPVIFLTAISKDKSHVTRGYEAGAVDYLFKPYDPDALRTKVATFVELGKRNARMRAQHEALRLGSERELAAFKEWSERRYEDLADSMPQIVWTADSGGNISYYNKRWSELARDDGGSSDADPPRAWIEAQDVRISHTAPRCAHSDLRLAPTPSTKGLQFATIAHPSDLDSFASGWSSAVKAGVEWEAELRLGSPSSGYRFHLVRAVPRHDEHGNVTGWVGTATDIDARVRADRALRMLADASQCLNRSLGGDPAVGFEPRCSTCDLELVLRSALAILGGGAILDVHGSEPASPGTPSVLGMRGTSGERLRIADSSIDVERLADPRFDLGPATVGYTGRAEVYLDVQRESSLLQRRDSAQEQTSSGRGAEHLRFLCELGVSAYMCIPLVSRDRTIGTLTFVKLAPGERFEEADVEVAGDLAGRIAVAIDNARLHMTTEKRREELELANKSKDVFLATLSHELRTPLNAIVGWTDMMKNGTLSGDELAHAMETIERNAQALSGLVGDLLDVSRIVTGTLKLESKRVSLAAVVESAVVAARPQCTSKDIELELKVENGGGVIGDPGRLRQVVANLLSNAIKFSPRGGRVSVRIDGDDERVRVTVSDTGDGIAAEFLPHVFERFRQEHTDRAGPNLPCPPRLPRSIQAGLGLGLAIVKHLVEEHGGTVSAWSEGRGKGASFSIELPAVSESTSALEEEARSVQPTGEPDLSGVHVLIVEDDPDGNELVCTILERYGARVTSATTAAAALDALDAGHPQVLVSDIGLPDMDGMDLIKTVRSRTGDGTIPAVALTAYASRQDATKAIAAGFDAHVAKPVQPATLGSVVVRLLARSGAALGEPSSRRSVNASSPSAA